MCVPFLPTVHTATKGQGTSAHAQAPHVPRRHTLSRQTLCMRMCQNEGVAGKTFAHVSRPATCNTCSRNYRFGSCSCGCAEQALTLHRRCSSRTCCPLPRNLLEDRARSTVGSLSVIFDGRGANEGQARCDLIELLPVLTVNIGVRVAHRCVCRGFGARGTHVHMKVCAQASDDCNDQRTSRHGAASSGDPG